jgi:hypothetical protein
VRGQGAALQLRKAQDLALLLRGLGGGVDGLQTDGLDALLQGALVLQQLEAEGDG